MENFNYDTYYIFESRILSILSEIYNVNNISGKGRGRNRSNWGTDVGVLQCAMICSKSFCKLKKVCQTIMSCSSKGTGVHSVQIRNLPEYLQDGILPVA